MARQTDEALFLRFRHKAARLLGLEQAKVASSQQYWEQRYSSGGNSGPGSYGRLARYKAEYLNRFVAENRLETVIEFGCGDGSQLELAEYPDYQGYDVAQTAVDLCRERFTGDQTKRFSLSTSEPASAELTLSLDVIYHLVEDEVYEAYMSALFESASRFVVIYASDQTNERDAPHVRHRSFTGWVAANRPDFMQHSQDANPYPFEPNDPDNTSHASFFVFAKVDA